jgi:hypothetical protein
VKNAFQRQKDKNQAEAAANGKPMKRLPKPILVNYTTEASYIDTTATERGHVTGTLASSIHLSFLRPGDDGGSVIIGYDVYARPVSCDQLLLHKDHLSFSSITGTTESECKPQHRQLTDHMLSSWSLCDSFEIDEQSVNKNNNHVKIMTVSSALQKAKLFVGTHLGITLDVVTLQVNNLHVDTFYGK